MKRFFIVVLVLLSIISPLQKQQLMAQLKNGVVLLQGVISEAKTREPVQTELNFIDEENKKVKAKSEINGKYTVVLTPGKKYVITAKDYFISNEYAEYTAPMVTEYTEIRKDLKADKIYQGMELIVTNAFSPNSSSVNSNALSQLQRLDGILEQNLKIKVDIIVSTSDTYAKPEKKKVTEPDPKNPKKKITKTVNVSGGEKLKGLLESRLNNLRDILSVMKIRESRYEFVEKLESAKDAPKPKAKPKKKGKNQAAEEVTENKVVTLRIVISELLKL